ncbi:MAG: DNA repair protein RecN [Armatimonadetes bacterium]|nr:DNA repair protein RecN [Armatimonadota bacterium]
MITNLNIKNFVIVKELELKFEEGLQILTGETGTGKSIIVGAINVIFGGAIHAGMLYDETKPALLEVTFNVDKSNIKFFELLSKHGVDFSENEVFFLREIFTNLRGKSFLNGRRISNSIVKEFREVLLDFHSQRDQQKLFNENIQLEVLDKFGNLVSQRDEFEQNFKELQSKIKELEKLQEQEKTAQERVKLYEYQIGEFEEINLKIGEDEKLQNELNFLNHAEEILNHSSLLEQEIYEKENSVYDIINSFIHKLSNFKDDNSHIKKAITSLRESLGDLDDTISEIRQIQNSINLDSLRQEEVEEKLNTINSIKAKYKKNVPEILDYCSKIKGEISSFTSVKNKIIKINQEIDKDSKEIWKKANLLTKKRKEAAKILEDEIQTNIHKLAIPDARIKIRFDKEIIEKKINNELYGLTYSGQDKIEIFFSANIGVKMQPFKYAASGGELSRFLLTIKKILSDKLEKKTIIFDEIDIGLGGKTAELLGEFIFNISKFHQVICITHLPQIASYAKDHFLIDKKSGMNLTEVEIKKIDKTERKQEIARMLAGSKTELALKHAAEILSLKRK